MILATVMWAWFRCICGCIPGLGPQCIRCQYPTSNYTNCFMECGHHNPSLVRLLFVRGGLVPDGVEDSLNFESGSATRKHCWTSFLDHCFLDGFRCNTVDDPNFQWQLFPLPTLFLIHLLSLQVSQKSTSLLFTLWSIQSCTFLWNTYFDVRILILCNWTKLN